MPGSMFSGYTAPNNSGMQILSAILQGLGKLGQTGMGLMQHQGQNAVANRLANTQNPPRAGLVDPGANAAATVAGGTPDQAAGLTPQQRVQMWGNATGQPTGGTAPFTGGVEGLKMKMAMDRLNQQGAAQQMLQQQHQASMTLNNLKAQNLQQYGAEQPGTIRQPAAAKDPTQSESWIKDLSTIRNANAMSHQVFGTDIENLQKSGQWKPMDANGNPVKAGGLDQGQVSYYQNDQLKLKDDGHGSYNWQVPAQQYQDAMKVINPAWALHQTYKSSYGKLYQDSIQNASDQANGTGPQQPQQQPTPLVAGTTGKSSAPNSSGASMPVPNQQMTGPTYIQQKMGIGPQPAPTPGADNMPTSGATPLPPGTVPTTGGPLAYGR